MAPDPSMTSSITYACGHAEQHPTPRRFWSETLRRNLLREPRDKWQLRLPSLRCEACGKLSSGELADLIRQGCAAKELTAAESAEALMLLWEIQALQDKDAGSGGVITPVDYRGLMGRWVFLLAASRLVTLEQYFDDLHEIVRDVFGPSTASELEVNDNVVFLRPAARVVPSSAAGRMKKTSTAHPHRRRAVSPDLRVVLSALETQVGKPIGVLGDGKWDSEDVYNYQSARDRHTDSEMARRVLYSVETLERSLQRLPEYKKTLARILLFTDKDGGDPSAVTEEAPPQEEEIDLELIEDLVKAASDSVAFFDLRHDSPARARVSEREAEGIEF